MAIPHDIETALISGATKDGAKRLVVGAVIDIGERVLLLRRNEHEFMGGIFELPSGRVEDGETLSVALVREVIEETSLNVTEIGDFLGAFDYISGGGNLTRQLNFRVSVAGEVNVVLSEHESFLWADAYALVGLEITDSTRGTLEHHFETLS